MLKEANRTYKGSEGKIKRQHVIDYLKGEPTYTLHRPIRHRGFPRLVTIPSALNSHWQCDLADFQNIRGHQNWWNRYLLVCVDVLSRKLYGIPVKSKSPRDMLQAFENIFKQAGTRPMFLASDAGLEFKANKMKQFFKDLDIFKPQCSANFMLVLLSVPFEL